MRTVTKKIWFWDYPKHLSKDKSPKFGFMRLSAVITYDEYEFDDFVRRAIFTSDGVPDYVLETNALWQRLELDKD